MPWFPIATSAPSKRTTAKRREVTVVVRCPGGDLALCITVHKSQGSTQRRILSRVRSWDDIRILQNYDVNPSSLAHLLLLRNDRDSTIVRWLAAFDDETLLHGAAGARFDLERLRLHDATLGPRPNARRASKARTGANAFSPDSWLLVPILRRLGLKGRNLKITPILARSPFGTFGAFPSLGRIVSIPNRHLYYLPRLARHNG